jgi:hypothetical protein
MWTTPVKVGIPFAQLTVKNLPRLTNTIPRLEHVRTALVMKSIANIGIQ